MESSAKRPKISSIREQISFQPSRRHVFPAAAARGESSSQPAPANHNSESQPQAKKLQ
jgi:hypothetical protein